MATVIFGHGYTGSRLLQILPESVSTEIPDLCTSDQIPFDFNFESTWNNLPYFDTAIITFKMNDELQAQKFAQLLKGKKVLILSSARNLTNLKPDQIIDEQCPLADSMRAKSEKHFEETSIILYLGLIWGETRTPQKWLSESRIQNGCKYINMIHVDDLCQIIKHFLEIEFKHDKYLVSDGKGKKWSELASHYGIKLKTQKTGLESRIFNTAKLLSALPETFTFKQVVY